MAEEYEISMVKGFQVCGKNYASKIFDTIEEAKKHILTLPKQTIEKPILLKDTKHGKR
jgi:hypothetical protein